MFGWELRGKTSKKEFLKKFTETGEKATGSITGKFCGFPGLGIIIRWNCLQVRGK